jgi:hypothetical protein
MIHIPDETEQDEARFLHTTQKSMQFKTYRLFRSGTFPINTFRAWLTKGNWNHRSEAIDRERPLYFPYDVLIPTELGRKSITQVTKCAIILSESKCELSFYRKFVFHCILTFNLEGLHPLSLECVSLLPIKSIVSSFPHKLCLNYLLSVFQTVHF